VQETEAEQLNVLLLLQHGDSFFPSGSVSFSHGVESLAVDGLLNDEDAIRQFIERQVSHRWRTCDWGILAAISAASGALGRVFDADRALETVTLPFTLRMGSRRAAEAFLSVHSKLGSEAAKGLLAEITAENTPGHLVTAQGVVWGALGLSLRQVGLLSLHGLTVGILGAALRLGIIGHVAAQRTLSRLHPTMAAAVASRPPQLEELSTSILIEDIAAMKHEERAIRLFAS
jgi:urease accessory protein